MMPRAFSASSRVTLTSGPWGQGKYCCPQVTEGEAEGVEVLSNASSY